MRKIALASLAALGLTLAAAVPALAHHSWGSYHWARTSNPFTLRVGDNVSSQWDPVLDTTIADWTSSSVLDLAKTAGGSTNKRCRPTSGRVEVCNGAYGNNGWLGVAQIWASGSHITQGTVKLNDTYFNTSTYNTSAWRNLVSCQEVGHTLGLDHQDESFDNPNLGTCMDYTSNPGTNQHPNAGDYDQLLCIYDPASAGKTLTTSTHSCTGTCHLDTTTTVGSAAAAPGAQADVADLPPGAGPDRSTYVRDLGGGMRLITHVFWARG